MTEKKGIANFFQETKAELKKVTWPTKKETLRHTSLVVVISVVLATFIGVVDYVFTIGLDKLISLK